MRRRHSLRFRLALAFAGLGAVLSMLFAVGIWFAAQDVSRRLIDETLDAEMADYMARRARNPRSLPPATASLVGYLVRPAEAGDELPAAIAQLPPGRHDVQLDGVPFRVAVADRDGDRYVLLFNETRQRNREQRFLAYLVGGGGLITLLVVFGGLWLAGQVIAPLSDLASAVSRADPQDPAGLAPLAKSNGPGDEIDELAHAIDRYQMRLAAFIERERSFAADASHELRTPLAAISGAAEVLAEDPILNAAHRERITRITRASEEMVELISALLLLSREEDSPVEAPCDAGRIVHDCIGRYREQAEKRNTRIDERIGTGVQLAVPPAFLAMIVANLVHNAVVHTRGGCITVSLDPKRLVVADTGSGIPSADLAHVFERHFRGPDSSGSGIGLSLVKRICERLGWNIALESDPVSGTRATLGFGI